MTWEYSGDPCSSPKDETRFLLGDTRDSRQIISDEEINYLLKKYGSPLSAAIQGARSISAKYSSEVDEKTGGISRSNSKLAEQYRSLANELTNQQADGDMDVFGGGISVSDVESRQDNENRTPDEFRVGMDDDKSVNQNTDRRQSS